MALSSTTFVLNPASTMTSDEYVLVIWVRTQENQTSSCGWLTGHAVA